MTQTAIAESVGSCWSPEFGARPLKRAIQRHIQNLLADAILTGRIQRGDLAWIDFENGQYRALAKRQEAPSAAEPAST